MKYKLCTTDYVLRTDDLGTLYHGSPETKATSVSAYIYNLWCPLSTGILHGRLQRVTIPEGVIIKFVLLKMSKVLLETC